MPLYKEKNSRGKEKPIRMKHTQNKCNTNSSENIISFIKKFFPGVEEKRHF